MNGNKYLFLLFISTYKDKLYNCYFYSLYMLTTGLVSTKDGFEMHTGLGITHPSGYLKEDIDIYIPTILRNEMPGIPVSYFNGPWLPNVHVQNLVDYTFKYHSPIDILKEKDSRKRIIQNIVNIVEDGRLFNDSFLIDEIMEQLIREKQDDKKLYKQWRQKLKNKERIISVPNKTIDRFLEMCVKPIILLENAHKSAHGGEKGWSTYDSIKKHVPITSMLTLDIQDAFINTNISYVHEYFYDLTSKKFNKEEASELSAFLSMISTVYYPMFHTDALPVGSSISMILFNRLMKPIDLEFESKTKKKNITYTRWVDDIILTSPVDKKTNFERMINITSSVRENYPFPAHKIFYQEKEPFYIMGYEINNKEICRAVNDNVKKNRKPINPSYVSNSREMMYGDDDYQSYSLGDEPF